MPPKSYPISVQPMRPPPDYSYLSRVFKEKPPVKVVKENNGD